MGAYTSYCIVSYLIFYYIALMQKTNKIQGFTLIEILVVVALIAILAAITFIAINPAKAFADARNATRQSAVNEILSAVTQYTADQNTLASLGAIPTCPTTANIGNEAPNIDLSAHLVPVYIGVIPSDPNGGTDNNTLYTICQNSGRVTISAPSAEVGKVITVMR